VPRPKNKDVTASARISARIRAKNRDFIARIPQRSASPPVLGKQIISIDPGGTTGLAVRFPDGTWMTSSINRPSELWAFLNAGPDEVVFELFIPRGLVDHWGTYTIELVGGIKALIHQLNLHGFAHTPGERVVFISAAESMLKGREHTVHEVDALAHLLAHEGRFK
jgi:hypothetical protein